MSDPRGFEPIFELALSSYKIKGAKSLKVNEDLAEKCIKNNGTLFKAGNWSVMLAGRGFTVRYHYDEDDRRDYTCTFGRRPGTLRLGYEENKAKSRFVKNDILKRAEALGIDEILPDAEMRYVHEGLCCIDDGNFDFCLSDGLVRLWRMNESVTYTIHAETWFAVCTVRDNQRYATLYVHDDDFEAALESLEQHLEFDGIDSVWDHICMVENEFIRAVERDRIWDFHLDSSDF